MAKAIWQSVKNPTEYFGDNKDLVAFNQGKGGTLLVENNQAFEIFSKGSPLVMPATLMTKQKPKPKPKKKTTKQKIINVAAMQNGKPINIQVKQVKEVAPEMNLMPPVVLQENQIGDISPSLIRTGSVDPLEKMRVCGEQEEQKEAPMPIPKVVEVEGK